MKRVVGRSLATASCLELLFQQLSLPCPLGKLLKLDQWHGHGGVRRSRLAPCHHSSVTAGHTSGISTFSVCCIHLNVLTYCDRVIHLNYKHNNIIRWPLSYSLKSLTRRRKKGCYAQREGKSTTAGMQCTCCPPYLLLFTATTGSSYDVISMVEHGDTLSNYNLGDYKYSENKQWTFNSFIFLQPFLLHHDLLTLRWQWCLFVTTIYPKKYFARYFKFSFHSPEIQLRCLSVHVAHKVL